MDQDDGFDVGRVEEGKDNSDVVDFSEVSKVHPLRFNKNDFVCNYCRIWVAMAMMSLKLDSKLAKRRERLTSQKELKKRKHKNGLIALNTESVLKLLPGVRPLSPKEQKKKKAKNEADRVEKNKATNGAYNVDAVGESTFLSQDSLDFEEVP